MRRRWAAPRSCLSSRHLLPTVACRCFPIELPDDLVWITNDEDPTFAAPEAKRGGTFRTSMQSFPLTLRRVGPDSNGGFAPFLRYNQMSLVQWHPNTRRPIPSLASHWAFDADGKTVYYRIDDDARWSDGVPVTAADFEFTRDFMRSKDIVAPWYNDYYTTQVVDIRAYGDRIVGVRRRRAAAARGVDVRIQRRCRAEALPSAR